MLSVLFRKWWMILIQGILLIALSFIIFNNPDAVLAAMALWLGIILVFTGFTGMIAWLSTTKRDRDFFTLLGSFAILIIGLLMILKMFVTVKAITLAFGVLVAIVGLVLISGGWSGRKNWSLWWLVALIGVIALIMGIKSIMNMYAGAQNISALIGIPVLIAGIGLICLSLLKKKVVTTIRNKITDMRS